MYKKIIVAIDIGTLAKGEPALRRAMELLDAAGEIVALNVVEDIPSSLILDLPQDFVTDAIGDADLKLQDLCKRLAVSALVEVRTGSPAAAILKAAEEHEADLLIVSSHIPDLSNYFLGATADRVVRHAKCSVLVERG